MDPDRPAPLPVVHLPVLAELIPRGDGTFILKPKVPDQELDTWITVRQAAEVIGHVGRKAVYRLLDGYLVYRRPLRKKILVSLKSAHAYREATQDPEFWRDSHLQQRLRKQVQTTMDHLAEAALPAQPVHTPPIPGSVPEPT